MRNKRRDGVRIKGLDAVHAIIPYVMPKRTEAEVSSTEKFDITELLKYMKERNEKEDINLKLFHAICTAVGRTIYLRPKLNIFISGKTYYQRKNIILSFVVKRQFEDASEESLMFMDIRPDMNLDSVSKMILGDVSKVRKEKSNDLDKLMETVGKLPRFVLTGVFGVVKVLEYNGIMPRFLSTGDPNYATVLLSNLGSIGAGAPYHHLNNYGTCSLMMTIGTMYKEKVIMKDGSEQERDMVDCTFIIDERIADGFYFAKSLRITKYLLENPEALMQNMTATVPVEL
ncbi:MAG: 2-oxo acid dehydrogenase subunit E2 [Clostridiales bacterium]|nr:2-oxo acid dehydrogenase subunit E2 [Clostridiales bacterium]